MVERADLAAEKLPAHTHETSAGVAPQSWEDAEAVALEMQRQLQRVSEHFAEAQHAMARLELQIAALRERLKR